MTKPRPAGVANTVSAMGFPRPARTQGTLGYGDAADPNVTTRLGDTPGTAGRLDAGAPADAKQALTDIAHQFGASGASSADKGALEKAANDGDRSAAADCTDDLEGSDDRNTARKTMFQAAAKAAPLKPKAAAAAAPAKT